ncbi:VOC family protein [Bacillus sp. CGMCC 1.16541]|uniref:VOC family protein n=1 Tax=Bacillus sp. CGMCC 1.16541 TaxID=2185143 RepID=UPI000D72B878|nr:VOC family protein [Bacillus sp. CGMCC 1.16541]
MDFHTKPITFVKSVTIKVQNVKQSITFYQELIGLKVLKETERTAHLTADGTTILLSIEQPDHVIPKQPRTTGLYHFALLLPSRADLGDMLKHLIQSGYPLQGASDHLVSEAIYLADPDGNGIEIYTDREASEWEWNNGEVLMATEPLHVESVLSEGQADSWSGLPARTLMGHIHLHVSELKKTKEFYTKGLGFELVNQYGTQALFISSGNYHHHIGLNTWNGIGAPTPSENSVGLKSFTLMYPSEETRANVVNNVRKIGATVSKETNSFVTTDPSGNRIYLNV